MSNRKVLDYHDVLLYAQDVRLLTGSHWLNDQACYTLLLKLTRVDQQAQLMQ